MEKHLTLRDILTRPVVTTTAERPALAALETMRERRISALVVVEGDRPAGIFTERDAVLLASRHRDPQSVTVGEVMSKPPLTAPVDTEYREAYRFINERGVRHLIVVDDQGRLAGIVSESNFLDHLGYEYLVRLKEVGAVMNRRVVTLPEEASTEEAVQLMARHRMSCVVIERSGRPVGILTERDVVRLAQQNLSALATPVGEVMTAPIRTALTSDPLDATVQRMHGLGVRRLVVVDAEGQLVGLVTRHDVTQALYGRHIEQLRETIAHLREELARQPDRLFRYLVDHTADAMLVSDAADGRIVEANDQACSYLGYSREEILALRVPDISRSFETSTWEEQVALVRSTGRRLVQTEHRRRDGVLVPTEVSLRYAPGEPNDYVVGVMRDISERQRFLAELAESEARLRVLIEAVPDAVQFKDGEGRWLVANSVCLDLFGLPESMRHGLTDAEIGERVPALQKAMAACLASDEEAWASAATHHTEEVVIGADGRKTYWDVIKVPLFHADGRRRALVVVSRDVTARQEAETELRLAASVFKSSREGIAITDAEARILDVNDAFCRITGYPRDEVVGQNPRLLRSGLHGEPFYETMWGSIRDHGFWSGEVWNRRRDGSTYLETLTITAVKDAKGDVTYYVGIFSDITVLKQHERQLEQIAHYDALTGIPNRVLLADRMRQAIAQAKRDGGCLAVGYLDLDGFKPINDRYGHEAGDRLLVEIARRLKATLRDSDTVARLGGDEFVFLMAGNGKSECCTTYMERILGAITRPVDLQGHAVTISASVGVTLFPQDDGDPDMLLRHADQAMYQAKQNGRNRFHLYDPEHDRRARSHHEAFVRIQAGLATGEFELQYQPKVNMRSGRVIGAEALVRWRHPEYGLLPPAEFLPVIENSELDGILGDWVLRTALDQMQIWQEQGLDLEISVNISAYHLQQANFPDRLVELLAAHPRVPSRRLQLEVLETTALQDMAGVSDIMRHCRAQGVSFALDDFGTGYSSLTYLKRLPAESLKIDQSFVRDMLADPEDLAIIQGVVALARAFGHQIIAEGVETAEHGLRLLELGCELAQGYGIAKAMPAAELAGWVATWRADPRWLKA